MEKEHIILLSTPFMATTKTIIDVHYERLTMIVLCETVHFKENLKNESITRGTLNVSQYTHHSLKQLLAKSLH